MSLPHLPAGVPALHSDLLSPITPEVTMKPSPLSLVTLWLFALSATSYASDLQVVVQCPSTVKAGAPLDVQVQIYNETCWEQDISSGMVMMFSNAGQTLGTIKILGPWPKLNRGWTVPAATCQDGYFSSRYGSPGVSVRKTVRIVGAVPRDKSLNTLVEAMYSVTMRSQGSIIGSLIGSVFGESAGSCIVKVVP